MKKTLIRDRPCARPSAKCGTWKNDDTKMKQVRGKHLCQQSLNTVLRKGLDRPCRPGTASQECQRLPQHCLKHSLSLKQEKWSLQVVQSAYRCCQHSNNLARQLLHFLGYSTLKKCILQKPTRQFQTPKEFGTLTGKGELAFKLSDLYACSKLIETTL